jgi:hypothetical protein
VKYGSQGREKREHTAVRFDTEKGSEKQAPSVSEADTAERHALEWMNVAHIQSLTA